jgi:hypothetical protein
MKKVLLLGLALLFVSSAVSAQQLALYVDAERTAWCSDAPAGYVWAYLFGYLPEGFQCIEINTILMTEPVGEDPYTSIEIDEFDALNIAFNADLAPPAMGTFPNSDLGVCYNACYHDWTWLVRARLFIYIADPMVMYIRPYQSPTVQAFPKILDCEGTELEAFALTNLYINGCGPVGVEESSWGAIKNMYE